ncbi:DUF58 domain-containing protein [Halobacteriales archaeon QH_10_67_13]|nr:MAG: DUF58 domain-containing protein [Halobacteriales archaeon QH_10_67_13]
MSDRTTAELADSVRRRVRPWTIGVPMTLALVLLGVVYANETLLAAAAVPLAYLAYGTISEPPESPSVTARRTVDAAAPAPGESVSVTLSVTNAGDRTLTDLRVVDGVPEPLAVTDGRPRLARSLGPGETATTTYAVESKRGTFDFEDPAVRIRSLSGSTTITGRVPVAGDRELTATTAVREPPVRGVPLPRAGRRSADEAGPGREFYAPRPYRPTDPIRQVDWRHLAKTGKLVTVQYRREQATRTVLVVDGSRKGRVAPRPGASMGTALCGYAAERLYEALRGADAVTTVAVARGETTVPDGLVGPDGLAWVDSTDRRGRAAAEGMFRALQRTPDDRPDPEGTSETAGTATRDFDRTRAEADYDPEVRAVLDRLPAAAQVIVCTPLVDDWPVELAEALCRREYPTVVVSPDVTTGSTAGQRLAAVRRSLRADAIEREGGAMIDWTPDGPIDGAIGAALADIS